MSLLRVFHCCAAVLVVTIMAVNAEGQSACDAMGCCPCDTSGGCDSCFSGGCCASGWGVSVDAIFLHRSKPSSRILAFNTDDPAENLNAADFGFGTESGFDASLTKGIGKCSALELRYLRVDGWDSQVTVATTADDLLRFNAADPIFVDAGDAITAGYESELQNAELSFRHLAAEWLEVLAGFRWVELKERGSGSLVNAAVPFDYLVTTRNRMYGAQLGAQTLLWNGDLFRFDVLGKAGLFANDASHHAVAATDVAAVQAGGSQDRTAFVGEIGLNGAAPLTSNVALRGGYRMLWVESVALATDQLAATDFITGNGIDADGGVFYQGAFVGVELTF